MSTDAGARPRRRFYLNFNPTAGVARHRVVADLVHRLEAAGAVVTRGAAETPEIAFAAIQAAARSGSFDAIVACGGDGTIRKAVEAIGPSGCALGAIMLGTGNVLAHELGLPRGGSEAAAMLLDGPTRPIDTGLVNGVPFLLMASAGFDGRVIAALDGSLKQRLGRAAFVPAMLGALRTPVDRLAITIDDGPTMVANWAVATRASRYGGSFILTRRTDVDRPKLHVVLARAPSRLALVRRLGWLARGAIDAMAEQPGSGIRILPADRVTIASATGNPVTAQVDGDRFGTTPLTIRSGGPVIALIRPAESRP